MKMPLTTVSLAMASFGDGYQYNSAMMKFASSMYSGSKYMMDPELRAKQVCLNVCDKNNSRVNVHIYHH